MRRSGEPCTAWTPAELARTAAVSIIPQSSRVPGPPARTSSSAASTDWVAYVAVMKSTRGTGRRIGGRPGSPVRAIIPIDA